MKRKESPTRLLAFFLAGFLRWPIFTTFRVIRSLPTIPWVAARQARSHPVALSVIGMCLLAGVSLMIWGVEHLAQTPSSDVATYNEAVWGVSVYRKEADPSRYCSDFSEWGGSYSCPSEEKIAEMVLDKRVRNLAQKDKFAELALNVKDPRISSRALYSMGTMYLGDAIDFEDVQSLDDAVLALQSALLDDPSYRDSFDKGSMTLAKDKRINLEVALRIRESVEAGGGGGEGEGEDEEGNLPGGFGAGKSNSGRKP